MPLLYYQNKSIPFNFLSGNINIDLGAGMEKLPALIKQWLADTHTFSIKTSGSTGTPKEISLKRELIEYSAHLTEVSFKLEEGDNLLCCLSMDYIAGMMMAFRALVLNCNLIVCPVNSNPLDEMPAGIKPDFASFVPMQIQSILGKSDPAQLALLNNMKAILVGGGPVNQILAEQIRSLQAPVYHTYSMTETYTHVAIRQLNGAGASEAYYPLKDVLLSKDERDCLTITSPITEGETLITNDIIDFQSDGGFIWLGRYDNVINSGGIKIQLEETEEKIKAIMERMGYQLPIMAGAISDEKLGQKLILVIETNAFDKFLKEELHLKLSQEMTRHKAPREIYFTTSLQYTHTGKIDRKATMATISKEA